MKLLYLAQHPNMTSNPKRPLNPCQVSNLEYSYPPQLSFSTPTSPEASLNPALGVFKTLAPQTMTSLSPQPKSQSPKCEQQGSQTSIPQNLALDSPVCVRSNLPD
jgi:hypothetical protein